jgi:hypothetical protein
MNPSFFSINSMLAAVAASSSTNRTRITNLPEGLGGQAVPSR